MPKQYLYRADTRSPDVIFSAGFTPRIAGGVQIQAGGQMIGGVSTTRNLQTALTYASAYGGYVYLVYAEGIDMLARELQNRNSLKNKAASLLGFGSNNVGVVNNLLSQAEVACESVAAIDVLAARSVAAAGGPTRLEGLPLLNDLLPDDLAIHHSRSAEWKIFSMI